MFDREWANAVWDYVQGADQREKAAEARNAALIRVHQDGVKTIVEAIRVGLGGIAEALRKR